MNNRRERRRTRQKIENTHKVHPSVKKIILGACALILATMILCASIVYFSYKTFERTNIAVYTKSGDVVVIAADPQQKTITTLKIPGNTQVEASRQMGKWRLKSIWKLGHDEKIGGRLLAETVTRSFRFPIDSYADEKIMNVIQGNIFSKMKSVLSFSETNMDTFKKVDLFILSLSAKVSATYDFDLADSTYLVEGPLSDGDSGFSIKDKIPGKLSSFFADNDIASKHSTAIIINESSDNSLTREIGEIIEVLGAKVVATSSEKSTDIDCTVSGTAIEARDHIAKVFNCKVSSNDDDKNIDIRLVFGEKFARRF